MDDFGNIGVADFPVIGMTCGGCAKKVKTHLEEIDGVVSADVSHESASAAVSYDPKKTDMAAMKEVVLGLGYKVEAPKAESITLPVFGMTCAHCSKSVREGLEAVDGVISADVSHEDNKAEVAFDPSLTNEAALGAVVVGLDYALTPPATAEASAPAEPAPAAAAASANAEVKMNIEGMTCSSCAGRVETALNAVAGVDMAAVNLALENAVIRYDPASITPEDIVKVVQEAGYGAAMDTPEGAPAQATFQISGMTCSSCSGRVETALRAADGVEEANVNLAIDTATVIFNPAITSAADLAKVVQEAGYGAEIKSDSESTDDDKKLRRERWTLIISALLTLPLVAQMVSTTFDLGFHLAPWLELVLATPVQFVVGSRYYIGAWHALKARAGNMDLLVAMGTTAAYFYSVWLVIALGSEAAGILYFEASTVVITLVFAGKYMETRAKRSASSALRKLLGLRPTSAVILKDGEEVNTPIAKVNLGDIALLRPGGRVPVDGIIVDGESELDEALITGESMPVFRRVGDEVIAGAINGGGVLQIKTSRVGSDTTLSKVAAMVESAQVGKAPIQKLVDRISAIFVPVIVVIAFSTLGIWFLVGASTETALVAAISVLVIACPCALGLATPTALVAGTGAGARAGVLIRDIATLERAKQIDTVVFDKTGTLTAGKPSVDEISAIDGDENAFMALAAAVQAGSEHPLGKAIMAEAKARGISPQAASGGKATAGEGIEVELDGETLRMGRGRFALPDASPEMEQQALEMRAGGRTVVWLSRAGKPVGLVAFSDPIRDEAKAAVKALHDRGVAAILMTGDNQETAEKVAGELGIDAVIADMRPEDKAREVAALEAAGKHVAMVGDGINDAPALAEATLGIAMGGGADVAIETAGFVLMRGDPRLVAAALDVSGKTAQRIRQNLFWAFAYNVIGIPIAAFGFLNPALAGAAMALSSVFVVSNSLLLKRWTPGV